MESMAELEFSTRRCGSRAFNLRSAVEEEEDEEEKGEEEPWASGDVDRGRILVDFAGFSSLKCALFYFIFNFFVYIRKKKKISHCVFFWAFN